jgi:hypothetical protein
MALQRLLHEVQRRVLVAGLRNVTLEDLAFLVDRAPQLDHLAIQFHVHLIKVPAPMPEAAHPADPLAPDVAGEHGTEPVPPHPHRLVAQVDPALKQEVLDVPQRQREPHIHHHHQADHLGRGIEVAERTGGLRLVAAHRRRLAAQSDKGHFGLTVPSKLFAKDIRDRALCAKVCEGELVPSGRADAPYPQYYEGGRYHPDNSRMALNANVR